jgi:hypothetical protein
MPSQPGVEHAGSANHDVPDQTMMNNMRACLHESMLIYVSFDPDSE